MTSSSIKNGRVIEPQSIVPGTQDAGYDVPSNYASLNEAPELSPDENSHARFVQGRQMSPETRPSVAERRSSHSDPTSNNPDYNVPDNYVNLDELATTSPVDIPRQNPISLHKTVEDAKNKEKEYERDQQEQHRNSTGGVQNLGKRDDHGRKKVSKLATQLYTISYLILFSFLGTLARLGLQAITSYPGAPVVFSELWANFGGSLFMGFLMEDRMLFKEEWGIPKYHQEVQRTRKLAQDEESGSDRTISLQAAKKAHAATKKTIPLYIGLATGFCGCFTSYSSFIRDAFLALSNDLPTPLNHPADYNLPSPATTTVPRNGGYSFMALLAVTITTVALCISGLHIGSHIAIASEPVTPSIPFKFSRRIFDPLVVFLAWSCWLGAIILAIFPPDRHSGGTEIWRGRAVFALVFAPLGCLGRFYASLYLNGKIASFPLGTFVVNVFGTAILGMSWDLQHVPLGGVIGCQVLQGIEDGFCGCLTTVSTWVSELSLLRRRHAYFYGAVSIVVALCFMIIIMGSMQWTRGFSLVVCTH